MLLDVNPISTVVAVIVAEPAVDPAVTTPIEFTVAMAVLLEDHVTDLLAALDGKTVAVSAFDAPEDSVKEEGEIVTEDTGIVIVI